MATWPPHWSSAQDRTLGWIDLGSLTITTEGGESYRPGDAEGAVATLFAHNLLCFYLGDLTRSALFPLALRNGWLTYSERLGGVAGLRAKAGRSVRWLLSADTWQLHGPEELSEIRWLWEETGKLGYPTPASLGQAMMREHYTGPRLRPPPQAAFDLMKRELSGGRSDLFQPGEYEEIYEEDLNSAYAAAIRYVPAGKCIRFKGEPPAGVFWIGEAAWVPSGEWPGVLSVRDHGRTDWPQSGAFRTVITSIESDAARGSGYEVAVKNGWYWSSWTDGFTPWTQAMHELRLTAGEHSGVAAAVVKSSIVASIGRFFSSRYRWQVLPMSVLGNNHDWSKFRGIPDMGRWPSEGAALPAVAFGDEVESAEQLPQVTAAVMATVRVWLHARMHACTEENVLASNYDAIYLREPSGLPVGAEPGEWKLSKHEHANLPARRWLIADDADKRPGQPRNQRSA